MSYEILPVTNFGEQAARVEELLAYPGSRPDGNFLLTADHVKAAFESHEAFVAEADTALAAADQPLIAERIPILAYGANANPPRMLAKLAKYGIVGEQAMVPYANVTVPNAAAVWHGQPGQTGSIFAELYKGEEVEGGQLTTHLSYLTPTQAAVVHASEGVTYALTSVEAQVGNQTPQQVLAYAALESTVLLQNGQPVGVEGLSNSTPLTTMTAREAVAYILSQPGMAETAEAETPEELVEKGLVLKLVERKARQTAIGQQLAALGLRRDYQFPAAATDIVPRLALASQVGNAVSVHGEATGAQSVTFAELELAHLRAFGFDGKVMPKGDIMTVLRKRAQAEQDYIFRKPRAPGTMPASI